MLIEKLSSIIPNLSPALARKIASFDIKITKSPKPSSNKVFDVDDSTCTLTIYVDKLSVKENRKLKKLFRESFDNKEVFIIDESSTDLLNRLYTYNHNNDDSQVLAFFKPILSPPDWSALRDALFLRNEFKNHRSISMLKGDIISRYGERGNTISNICTAGYFELTMIPLYNKSPEEYYKYFDVAIDRGLTAFFVNANMTTEKIKGEIKRRILSAKSYGLKSLHIHGIGKTNIKNIKESIEKVKREMDGLGFTEKNVYVNEGLYVLVVEILL